VRYDYDLTAWDDSPAGSRRPIGVSTARRVERRWTTVSRTNAQRALAGQPPLSEAETAELFASDELVRRLDVAVDPSTLEDEWLRRVTQVIDESTCERPTSSYQHGGGRDGRHTEHFGYLLAELQHVARSHPGAKW